MQSSVWMVNHSSCWLRAEMTHSSASTRSFNVGISTPLGVCAVCLTYPLAESYPPPVDIDSIGLHREGKHPLYGLGTKTRQGLASVLRSATLRLGAVQEARRASLSVA